MIDATEIDAAIYCNARTRGSLHIGGMMQVIDAQLTNARMAHEFRKGGFKRDSDT